MKPGAHIGIVFSAAPLIERAVDILDHIGSHLTNQYGTDVAVHARATNSGLDWLAWHGEDPEPFRSGPRLRPGLAILVPATFNTINKLASGINDQPAVGILNEAIGAGTPTLIVPMVNAQLAGHPAWTRSLAVLTSLPNVRLMDIHDGHLTDHPAPLTSGTGADVSEAFDPAWLTDWIAEQLSRPIASA